MRANICKLAEAEQDKIRANKKEKYLNQWTSHIDELNKIYYDLPDEVGDEFDEARQTIQRIMEMNADVVFD